MTSNMSAVSSRLALPAIGAPLGRGPRIARRALWIIALLYVCLIVGAISTVLLVPITLTMQAQGTLQAPSDGHGWRARIAVGGWRARVVAAGDTVLMEESAPAAGPPAQFVGNIAEFERGTVTIPGRPPTEGSVLAIVPLSHWESSRAPRAGSGIRARVRWRPVRVLVGNRVTPGFGSRRADTIR